MNKPKIKADLNPRYKEISLLTKYLSKHHCWMAWADGVSGAGETEDDAIKNAIQRLAPGIPYYIDKAATDALHISIACVSGINYLVTWNCKHIANAERYEAVNRLCIENGYIAPIICTPEELLGEYHELE